MAVREVVRMGDPRLLRVAEPVVDFTTPELRETLQDMLDTLADRNGAGLAAPQIGINKRIVIFGMDKNPRYPTVEPIPMTILINPQIEALTGDTIDAWEGCISIPGMRGWVPRYTHIRYRGYDEHGAFYEREVSDFHARVVQHECDHLDGILYPRRIVDLTRFGFIEELTRAGLLPALPRED